MYVKRISFIKMTISLCLSESRVRYLKNLDLHDSGLDAVVEVWKLKSFSSSIRHSQFHLPLVFTGPNPRDPTFTVINDKEKPLLVFPLCSRWRR